MAVELPKENYTGAIRPIALGVGDKSMTVGGEQAYAFHNFESPMPNPPRVAMEVYDVEPEEWPAAAIEPFKDVCADPVAWAKKCVDEYGAELIALQLASTDPNAQNRSAEEAAPVAKAVVEAVEVPVIIWGCGSEDKDAEVLPLISEQNQGKNLILGPVQEKNYRKIGAQAIAYQHTVVASSPIDINLAKQVNILLGNLGVPDDKIMVDPTTGGLGYGLEYTYSVMERIRQAALTQKDDKLQYPILCNLGKEVWKVKEVGLSQEEAPTLGDPKKRGIMMESVTAMTLLLAGADVLIMRHPESVKLVKGMISDLMA